MSNSQFSNGKLIRIKPITIKNDTDIQSTNLDLEQEEQRIRNQLVKAKEELVKLKEEKETVLQETTDEVEKLKLAWEEEKVHLQETVKQEAYQEGLKLGKEEGLHQYTEHIEKVNALVETARNEYHNLLDNSDQDIIDLAIHIAEKILYQKLDEKPENFFPLVHKAIEDIKDHSVISIHLNPENYELVIKQKEELMQIIGDKVDLSIYISEKATIGSCIIEYPYGKIDASIDTQLNEIRQVLYTIVNGE
ncbi:flagellar assembly protein FliH [Ornithinibacillus halophilus]|uniref:Flagellar assembly protein FliH n=1 Tax=Ornithinibacillus halophilus TaxID=930117 RepID=A0A1M5CAT6_9BACI|nr:flagellar assembly protein FliH [Ornithinibacillus halophilus]SHF51532.1 flagellar assembly protein FliH [Ornithinibacillus halophilus]